MVVQEVGEHCYSKLGPSSHSESQQILVVSLSDFLHIGSVASRHRYHIWAASISKSLQAFDQILLIEALIDVEIQDCAAPEVGVLHIA